MIENLGLAGREKQETKFNRMTETDIWTKKPLKSKVTYNADPREPGMTIKVNTANKTLNIATMEEIFGPISITLPQINCTTDAPDQLKTTWINQLTHQPRKYS